MAEQVFIRDGVRLVDPQGENGVTLDPCRDTEGAEKRSSPPVAFRATKGGVGPQGDKTAYIVYSLVGNGPDSYIVMRMWDGQHFRDVARFFNYGTINIRSAGGTDWLTFGGDSLENDYRWRFASRNGEAQNLSIETDQAETAMTFYRVDGSVDIPKLRIGGDVAETLTIEAADGKKYRVLAVEVE